MSRLRSRSIRIGAVWTALIALGMAFAGCDDESISAGNSAEISISPTDVQFPTIELGASSEQIVIVSNLGNADLVISSFDWAGDVNDFSVRGLDGLTVPPTEERSFTVVYEPQDAGVDAAVLTLFNNSFNNPQAEVRISSAGQSATIAAFPSTVEFDASRVGTTISAPLELTNIGSEPFDISGLRLIAGSTEFALRDLPDDLPRTLTPNETVAITVDYTPSSGGLDEGEIVVSCDADNCEGGSYSVPVRALLRSPQINAVPASIGFGDVPMGETATADLFVRNEGEATLLIDDIRFAVNAEDGDDEIQIATIDGEPYDTSAPTTAEVAPDGQIVVTISYTPEDAMPDAETLIIESNDPVFSILTVPVGGTLSAPRLEVVPEEVEFPRTARGFSSTRTFRVINSGTQTLELGEVNTRPLGAAFAVTNLDGYPTELGPGEEYVVEVEFSPPDVTFYDGALIVTATNDPARREVTVRFRGNGDTEPVCELRVVPPTVNFGVVARGSLREESAVIENRGSGPCTVSTARLQATSFFPIPLPGFSFSDAFKLESISLPDGRILGPGPTIGVGTEIGPGESFVVTTSYFPRTLTPFSEDLGDTASVELVVTDSVSGDTVTCGSAALFGGILPIPLPRDCGLNLQARAGIADIAAVPTNVDFGLVTLGCNSQTVEVDIYNTGSADVELASIGLEACSGEFDLAGVPALPATITPGDNVTVRVRYRPEDETEDACRLVIESSAEGGRLNVPLRGEGTTVSRTIDHFEQSSGREVDVLFVVDNSGSMGEEQSNLARNFSRFIDEADTWDSDWRIGIVTTQIEGDISHPRGATLQPGQFVGDPRVLTEATPGFEAIFERDINVGTGDPGTQESGLASAQMALTDPHITDFGTPCDDECVEPYGCHPDVTGATACGGYNRGFLRESASLEIVFVSDEEDQSRASLDFFVDFFRAIKGVRNTSLFHASAIVGDRGGCSGTGGSADAGNRYIEVADRTDGVIRSICESEFASALTEIGSRAFGLRREFFLSRLADPATIEVRVEGTPTDAGWSYDPASNSIVWEEDETPLPGTEFEVEYEALCLRD